MLARDTGYFSRNWAKTATQYGLEVELLRSLERETLDPAAIEAVLRADRGHALQAVMVVHNETATGIRHDVAAVRAAIDRAKHSALYLVDTISSLASYDFRMDEWGVDAVIDGSQKGLMLPPGMSFTAINERAWARAQQARNPRRYWDWRDMIEEHRQVRFCGTAPIPFFYGLEASLDLLEAEGLENVFARHRRLATGVRACLKAWTAGGGPELFARDERFASNSLTAVLMPTGHDAERVRERAESRYGVALGRGLADLQGRVFRIGRMGDLNEPMLLGALAGIEMTLDELGVPLGRGGLEAAMLALRG